jgi:hemoglobin
MSKFELQETTFERSGVTHAESLEAATLEPSIYDRIGKDEGFRLLSELFYRRVFDDSDATWFLNIFSSSTRDEAVENQYLFFVQTFGGPDLYRQKKGKYARLVGRHANYNIGPQAAKRWVHHMKLAMDEHDALRGDVVARDALYKYFLYTAHYIVVASDFMRPDQVNVLALCIYVSTYPSCLPCSGQEKRFSSLSFIHLPAERRNENRCRPSMVKFVLRFDLSE